MYLLDTSEVGCLAARVETAVSCLHTGKGEIKSGSLPPGALLAGTSCHPLEAHRDSVLGKERDPQRSLRAGDSVWKLKILMLEALTMALKEKK